MELIAVSDGHPVNKLVQDGLDLLILFLLSQCGPLLSDDLFKPKTELEDVELSVVVALVRHLTLSEVLRPHVELG